MDHSGLLRFRFSLWPRRSFLEVAALAFPGSALAFTSSLDHPPAAGDASASDKAQVSDAFPTQSADLAREMVRVSHFDLNRVQQLVEAQPSLARAAWDWGFGDWETALCGASHMGNRPIAEYLISKGARPSLFSSAMFGHLDVVKSFISAQPGVQRIRGPHGLSLLLTPRRAAKRVGPSSNFFSRWAMQWRCPGSTGAGRHRRDPGRVCLRPNRQRSH